MQPVLHSHHRIDAERSCRQTGNWRRNIWGSKLPCLHQTLSKIWVKMWEFGWFLLSETTGIAKSVVIVGSVCQSTCYDSNFKENIFYHFSMWCFIFVMGYACGKVGLYYSYKCTTSHISLFMTPIV